MKYSLLLTILLLPFLVRAQQTTAIRGTINDEKGNPIEGVTVMIKETLQKTKTDKDGKFHLSLAPGSYTLFTTSVGFRPHGHPIRILQGQELTYNTVLRPDHRQLQQVNVIAKGAIGQVRESPFNVQALDAKAFYNTSMELGDLLNRASGVKVRQSGGLGSGMSINLNGFTGRNVKIFMDGVPMSGFGSAFQLNNIPVNMADRIEIYKGVVPIEFGADALGGVINIVTNQSANSFVDASYSFGSFNTHKANVSFGYTAKNHFSIQGNAFMNYSDNSYKMHLDQMSIFSDDGRTTQTQTGNYVVKRFNDRYRNQTAMLKAGFVSKWWADRAFLGLTVGHEDAQIQNSSKVVIVYGQRHRSAETLLPSLEYEKRNFLLKGLQFKLTANYNHNTNKNADTAARTYNWYGQYIKKSSQGESGTSTLTDYYNNNISSTANLSYRINDRHSISVNDVVTGYTRKLSGTAVEEASSASDTMRRSAKKNVLGISYRYAYNKKLNFNLFGKQYYQQVTGPKDTSTSASRYSYVETSRSFNAASYGLAATYFFGENFQLKASFERALQLPSETQLFGDEVLTTANSALQPEKSINGNLGARITRTFHKDHVVYVDINGYYRWTKDFIKQEQNSRYGTIGYVNFGDVRNIGVDLETRYYYKNRFMLGATVTYMDLRSKTRTVSSQSSVEDVTYGSRMPNLPYLYGNADAAWYVHDLFGKGNVLSLGYTLNYVGKYYLNWENLGTANTKNTLPEQLYHDFNLSYSMKRGRYNLGFEALNFTDVRLYDNWSLQKPGRSFNVKLRYFFRKKI